MKKNNNNIFDEIIRAYRITKVIGDYLDEKQEEYSNLCREFDKTLSNDQKEIYDELMELLLCLCIYKCKKYYFMGYDQAKKENKCSHKK